MDDLQRVLSLLPSAPSAPRNVLAELRNDLAINERTANEALRLSLAQASKLQDLEDRLNKLQSGLQSEQSRLTDDEIGRAHV